MFCENCGERLPNGARFCTSCGSKVQVPAEPAQKFEVESNPQESALAEEVLAALREEEANGVQSSLQSAQEQSEEEVPENLGETEQSEEEVPENPEETEQSEEEVPESPEETEQSEEEVPENLGETEQFEEEVPENPEETEQSEEEATEETVQEESFSETSELEQLLNEQQMANDIEKSLQEQQLADEVEQALLHSNEMKQSLSDETWTPGVMQSQGILYGSSEGQQNQIGYDQGGMQSYGMSMNNGGQPGINGMSMQNNAQTNGMLMNNGIPVNGNGMPFNNGMAQNVNGMPMNNGAQANPNGMQNQQWNAQQGYMQNGQPETMQANVPTGQPVQKSKKQRKKLHILSKIAILEWVAVAVLLVGSYMMAQKYFSAGQAAKQYFTALMSGKVSDAYQFVDVAADGMVNEANFKTVVAQQGCKKISGYDIMRDVEKSNHMHEITIRYNVKESQEDFYYTVCMEKSSEKKFYLFDQWKVNVGDVIAKKVQVTVPSGTKVSIDGKELSEDWKKVQEDGDCYTIPKMFYGTYEAKATHPIYEDETFTFRVDGEESTGRLPGFTKVKEEALQDVTEQAMNDFKVYWNGMTKKTGFSQLQNLSQLSEENYSSEDDYANMLSRMASGKNEGIVALTFDDLNVRAVTENDGDGLWVQVEFTADMAYTFNAYDYWYETTYMERRTDSYQGTLYYVYEDGKWLQDNSDLGFYVY